LRGLIQILNTTRYAFIIVFLFLNSIFTHVFADNSLLVSNTEINLKAETNATIILNKELGTNFYFSLINDTFSSQINTNDSIQEFRRLAIEYAQKNDAGNASIYIENYIQSTLNTNFINNDAFNRIKQSDEFIVLSKKYKINFSFLNLFYLFSSIIGIFIVFILNIKRNTNNISILLISSFVLMHSIFIFHIFLLLSKLQFRYPHTLFMSIIFSFLYGPLIYFYFKKIAQQYTFRWIDILHLIPTLIIFIIVLPVYMLPEEDKLRVMLHVGNIIQRQDYVNYTFSAKLISLIVYGYLLLRIYFKSIKNNTKISLINFKWQKSIIWLGLAYIVSYSVYGLIISNVIPRIEILYHLQIITMALMVLYIGLMAYLSPNLFKSDFFEKHLYKYKKSGLTSNFSLELRENLMFLLEDEKLYRQNDINLEILSQRLGTTRHNTSQIINEHFNINFFELINKYRIAEALEILKNDKHNNLNIIDVAYEVGFNNKVTFNKSFKKILSQTPTQYIVSLRV